LLDVSLVPFPAGGDAQPLLHSKFNETNGVFSPNGPFFAYASDESGRYEIYVRPFPSVEDGVWQVSRDGGSQVLWGPNGRELFYVSADRKLMAVPVQIGGEHFTYGTPDIVIEGPYRALTLPPARQNNIPAMARYDVSHDGERFLMMKEIEPSARELAVVLNWFEELKRLAPTGD